MCCLVNINLSVHALLGVCRAAALCGSGVRHRMSETPGTHGGCMDERRRRLPGRLRVLRVVDMDACQQAQNPNGQPGRMPSFRRMTLAGMTTWPVPDGDGGYGNLASRRASHHSIPRVGLCPEGCGQARVSLRGAPGRIRPHSRSGLLVSWQAGRPSLFVTYPLP